MVQSKSAMLAGRELHEEEDPLASLTKVTSTKFEVSDKEGVSILRARTAGHSWAAIHRALHPHHPNWSSEQSLRLHFLGWLESKLLPEDVEGIFKKRVDGVLT